MIVIEYKHVLSVFVLLYMLLPVAIMAQTLFDGHITIGTQAGYSALSGYYKNKLDNGFGAGFFIYVPYNTFIMLNTQLVYYRYTFAGSSSSSMQVYALHSIPSLYFSLPHDITIYGGAGLSVQYHTVTALKTDAYDSTIKAGWLLNAGIAKSIFKHTIIMLDCQYSLSELSHKKLQVLTIYGKIGYRFALYSADDYIEQQKEKEKNKAEKIKKLYESGYAYLKNKEHTSALQCFHRILSLDSGQVVAQQHINKINEAIVHHNHAIALIQQNKKIEALPYLIQASNYIQDAEKNLITTRKQLKPEILPLQTKGIQQFTNNDYDGCIATMNIILMIDPDNPTAKAYIVRAKRIKETIKKFQ